MKPQLLRITHQPVCSFSVRHDMFPNTNSRWHYHEEMELICFHRGGGTQFIGDHVTNFGPGDIVLLGPNLPHYWMYDEKFFLDTGSKEPYSTVIHFKQDFLGEPFMHIPECNTIRRLLNQSKRGLMISEHKRNEVIRLIKKVSQAEGIGRVLMLIECLAAIADHTDCTQLSSLGFRYHEPNSNNERLNRIYRYTLKHFRKKITLEEIGNHASLNPGSFCRYFKAKTGKTYKQLLMEIRIGYACKLLLDSNQDIKNICYESGFNNFSCFHKGFKSATGFTPQIYREKYVNSA